MTSKFYEKSERISELFNHDEENRMLHQILLSSSDPILITSRDIAIIYVNPAWEKLTGYLYDEVIGKNPNILKSGKTPEKVYKKMWHRLSEGKSYITEDVINKRKDGSIYQLYSSIFPVKVDEKLLCYVQIHHDITRRKLIDELKSEFFSIISHELKTPLTVLKLLTQTKLTKSRASGSVMITTQELQLIDREIDRLTNLINDMLDTSRIETGKIHFNLEEISISECIQNVIENFRLISMSHTINFKKHISGKVICDRERIKQVLLNLLTNAIKYSPEGSTIEVGLKKLKTHIIVSVKDLGIGIPKNDLNAIFDKFYQVKKHRTSGFGLGLYISKEIIKHHHGKIWVKSEVSKGSTFYFSLPLSTS